MSNFTTDDMCQVNLDETKFLSNGVFDVAGDTEYNMFIDVHNQTVGTRDKGQRIYVYKGSHVTLKVADPNLQTKFNTIPAGLRSFDVPGFGTIPAASIAAQNVSILPLALLSNATFRDMAGANATPGMPSIGFGVLADVQTYGTLDSSDVSSNTVTFPVHVCSGCLVQNLGPCDQISTTFVFKGRSCGIGQDQAVTCCNATVGASTITLCPGQGMKAMGP